MAAEIHPTAVIDPTATIGEGVEFGPYAVIGPNVAIGDGCRIEHHVSIKGPSTIGPGNHFFPFASIGEKTQDLKYAGEPTFLEIGAENVFREFVTVNRGTAVGGKTIIGSHNTLLSYAHVAHDCTVGDHTIFSNNGTLAGHVEVGDYAVIGGLTAIHQFCRIGAHAILGGCTKVVQDAPPFFIADGNPAQVRGVNVVGLQRRGFTEEDLKALRRAYKILYDRSLNTTQAVDKVKEEVGANAHVGTLLEFVHTSQRGVIR